MTYQALLFTLAAIGISETVYLLRKRLAKEKPVCFIGGECHKVLESKYNRLFVVPNEAAGLALYIIIAFVAAFSLLEIEPVLWWNQLLKMLVFAGAVISFGLIFLQWRVIKAWCFWCLLSATTIFLMAIIALALK
ncbi:MAG: vitamin K epoxide reductase family protein [Candidatus Nealsonbacteria bacterium]|nr:vitamin K epoxide reductase family protein [Candidatus Nealsonbacteria bacterium]